MHVPQLPWEPREPGYNKGSELTYRQDYLGQGTPAVLIAQSHAAAGTLDCGLTEKQSQARTPLAPGSVEGGPQLLGDRQRYSRPTNANTQPEPLRIPAQL